MSDTPTPRTDTKTLALAMRVLSHHIRSEDGVTNAALAEAADRLDEQADHIRRLVEAGDYMVNALWATDNQ
jgi:ABC-type transporter Mla subunit MlaD